MPSRSASPRAIAAGVAVLAAALLLPGLGEPGFWSSAELPVLDRSMAALGEARTGLVRSPWLPDALRTAGVSALGGELGLRLPHAIAVVALAAVAAALARMRGLSALGAALAGLFALSMPALVVGGRTAIGNPFGELFGLLVVLGAMLGQHERTGRRAMGAALALVGLGGAVASAGVVLGGVIPLGAALLLAPPSSPRLRGVAVALWCALGLVAIVLVARQTDGYIPLLGAAKDLELVDKPQLRRFTAALGELGRQGFPWLPLGVVGLALGRDRGVAGWLLGGLVVASAWSLLYGLGDVPLRVALAIAAAAAVDALADERRVRSGRRAAVVLAALGMLVLGKELELAPETVAVPLHAFAVNEYPAELLGTAALLGRFAKLGVLALVIGLLLAPGDDAGLLARLRARVPAPARRFAAALLLFAVALWGAWRQAHALLDRTAAALSPKVVLAHHRALAQAGAVSESLASHRVRDRGLAIYFGAHGGPTAIDTLANRREIFDYLGADEPRAVLLRKIDLPAVYQQHRQAAAPLFVLDDSHDDLRLVANVLPPGEIDRNRIHEVLFTEPPALANETLVRFEEFVEVVGWEIDGPVVRGRKHTVQVVLRVLRALPGGAKLYTRLVGGRLSRINPEPLPLAEDLYPCTLWREGDYILHRVSFDAPWTEVPGEYDVVVGLRRSESKNFEISQPEGESGEFGVRIDDPKRAFAKIGTVTVW
ncbi:MAG: hypothetical protein U0168_31150 [Nannocystaceae bacterium]